MKHPVSVWFLVIVLLVLALGGLSGACGFLSDPTGAGMGMADVLGQLPIPDFTLPGIFLLLVMCLFPGFLIYGLLARPKWKVFDSLEKTFKMHWALSGALALGLILAVWLVVQAFLIGFSAPVQWLTAGLDLCLLVTGSVSPTRTYFAR